MVNLSVVKVGSIDKTSSRVGVIAALHGRVTQRETRDTPCCELQSFV